MIENTPSLLGYWCVPEIQSYARYLIVRFYQHFSLDILANTLLLKVEDYQESGH
jgi:hypothetical protein